jgi:hypothetical protein
VKRPMFLLLTLLLFGGLVFPKGASSSDAVVGSGKLLKKFLSNQVHRIEVIEINPEAITRIPISPSMLEKSPDYKLSIKVVKSTKYWLALQEVLTSMVIEPGSLGDGDMRWGLTFYDMKGNRLGALYFDGSGRIGSLNNVPVLFLHGDTVVEWQENNFFRQMNSIMDCSCPSKAGERPW